MEILVNCLTAEEFIRLFCAAGWEAPPEDQVRVALENSLATFSVRLEGRTVAMARLLGDRGMTYYIKDLAVDPACQGRGIGKALVDYLALYVRKQCRPGWYVSLELSSAPGKELFYEKQGFRMDGSGMLRMVGRD